MAGLGGEIDALAVSNNGDIAGLSTDSAGNRHAVRWRSVDDAIVDLGTLGGCCSEAYGINSIRHIVGTATFPSKAQNDHAWPFS